MTATSTFKILFTTLFLLVASLAFSTDHGIGVTLVSYTLDTQNQVSLGYTLTINAEVTNFDSVPFNGVLDFGLHNNEQTLTNTGIFDQPPYSGDSISLGSGETVPAIFSVNVNQPYFRPGPDVVVVWPISSQPIADSILIHLIISDPNGIKDEQEIPFTYAVVNNTIFLKGLNSKIDFKQVRIYNTIGQKLYEKISDFTNNIPLPPLADGIYVCELLTSDGKHTVIRICKAGL